MSATAGTPVIKTRPDPTPSIVGVIHLKGGTMRTYTSYIQFLAARAYYQLQGQVALAVCSAIGCRHDIGEDARVGVVKPTATKQAA